MHMDQAAAIPDQDQEATDRSAILMMLAYVEAECRRLGSTDAATHAALAAKLMQGAVCQSGGGLCNQRLPSRMPLH